MAGVQPGMVPLVVTGAQGRLGRLLRRIWTDAPPEGLQPLWSARGADADLPWDILSGPAPQWPEGAVVLHLAGILRGPPDQLAGNAAMVAPLLAACQRNGAQRVLVASTAAVYAPSARPSPEDEIPAPTGDYGRAKLAMERALQAQGGDLPVTCLRIGNVAGADALLSPRPGPLALDPVPDQPGGPLRSWIGPRMLARVLAALARQRDLPPVINIAADPPLTMGALLEAAGRDWQYGPPNPAVVPAAVMATDLLHRLCPLPWITPAELIRDLACAAGDAPQ